MNGVKLLKKIPFLSALRAKQLNEILSLASELNLGARQSVFAKRQDSDAMYIVLSGRIKIFTNSASKKRKTFAYLKEGEFFGEMSLLEGTTRTAAAQAVEASRLLVIRKKDFQRLLISDPKLTLYLLQIVCERLRRANEEIEGLLFRNILGRVAKAMLDLARRSGETVSGGALVLKERFTQQELADVVGTTREPLTRALSSLRRAGLVSLHEGRYTLPAPARLAGLCVEA